MKTTASFYASESLLKLVLIELKSKTENDGAFIPAENENDGAFIPTDNQTIIPTDNQTIRQSIRPSFIPAVEQLANVATLPGIVSSSIGLELQTHFARACAILLSIIFYSVPPTNIILTCPSLVIFIQECLIFTVDTVLRLATLQPWTWMTRRLLYRQVSSNKNSSRAPSLLFFFSIFSAVKQRLAYFLRPSLVRVSNRRWSGFRHQLRSQAPPKQPACGGYR